MERVRHAVAASGEARPRGARGEKVLEIQMFRFSSHPYSKSHPRLIQLRDTRDRIHRSVLWSPTASEEMQNPHISLKSQKSASYTITLAWGQIIDSYPSF